jgi:hypothetical protein
MLPPAEVSKGSGSLRLLFAGRYHFIEWPARGKYSSAKRQHAVCRRNAHFWIAAILILADSRQDDGARIMVDAISAADPTLESA